MAKQAIVLTKDEIDRVMVEAKKGVNGYRNHMIMMLSFYAGLRTKEIVSLKWKDVISPKGEAYKEIPITSNQTKGNEAQTLYFGTKVRQAIEQFYRNEENCAPDTALIKSSRGDNPMWPEAVQRIMKDIFIRAGIDEKASSHSGRRTFITRLSENGIEMDAIRRLARHSSLQMTQRYIQANPERLSNAVDSLD